METKKRYFVIISALLILTLFVGLIQYFKEFSISFVDAYWGKPNPGHSWSEMECSTGLCVTSGNKVGIGTDSPSKKLEVNGDGLFTGDVCNGAGKCLSSVFQTNMIAGTSPVCPAGQVIIAKMSGDAWHSSAYIGGYTQVMCGQGLSSDGTSLLVNL